MTTDKKQDCPGVEAKIFSGAMEQLTLPFVEPIKHPAFVLRLYCGKPIGDDDHDQG